MADPYLGEVRVFAGTFAPAGWAMCNGALLSISGNEGLYQLLGTTWGGDGQTTFGLPNLCGRVPLHHNNTYPLGAAGGVETVTLTQQDLAPHTHVANATSATGTAASPNGNLWAAAVHNSYSTETPTAPLNGIQPAGGNQPHNNMMPFVAMNYIIALEGVYPSQD